MNDKAPARTTSASTEPSIVRPPQKVDPDVAYQAALDYLYSYIDFSLQRNLRNAPGKFDLERMRSFLDLIDRPQEKYPIFHVAGTKGKGSVSAMIASALQAAGYKVGLYTSPHLEDYCERIQVDRQPIPRVELIGLIEELKPTIVSVPHISTFEITTGLAFYYFARQQVDVAVVEVGLGGRLDATNVVHPLISVITSLSYDHMALLGNTLAEIAGEKAGIIKEGTPVVLAPQKEEARLVVERIAKERSAPLVQVGAQGSRCDICFHPLTHSLGGQTFEIGQDPNRERVDLPGVLGKPGETLQLSIPLLGAHQVENAAVAYAALQASKIYGLQVSVDAIRKGFAKVTWPGRFEILQSDPPLVIDSAHNRDSAARLRIALDDYFPGTPVILITGESEDKDIEGIFAELMPRVDQVIATQAVHPRAIDPQQLVMLAQKFGRQAKAVVPVSEAVREALHLQAGGLDGKTPLVLATGSLFVVAEVRTASRKGMDS